MPMAGMSLAMVEYDRGEALAVINYVRRDVPLTKGPDVGRAFAALGALRSPIGVQLPFLTVRYDPRNWAMQLFAHNDPARHLLGTGGWLPVTEQHFGRLLYRLRGRVMPDLEGYDVSFSTSPWLQYEGGMSPISWPGQDMSVRRRAYEPEGGRVPFSLRNPCADIDLAVVGRSGAVSLLVDYKLEGASVDPRHHTHQAMSGILGPDGAAVPSMIVRYDPTGDRWKFQVHALNRPAEDMLVSVLLGTNAVAPGWRPNEWTYLDEPRWFTVLELAQRS